MQILFKGEKCFVKGGYETLGAFLSQVDKSLLPLEDVVIKFNRGYYFDGTLDISTMERGLIFDEKPAFIFDLGTGYSNVHLNIEQVDEPETDDMGNIVQEKFVKKWKADVQRVKNPVSYDKTVDAAIKDEFPNGEEEAALRKGILNKLDPDYVKLNEFAESVKQSYLKGYGEQ